MTAVLVHGVPDTEHMWDRLAAALGPREVVRLSLPGFGTEVPIGWTATKEAYTDWLVARLEEIGEPVDLVGHDWGAILCQRVASVRPALIRTLACGSGPLDVEYEWHPMAQAWQTAEVGEQVMTALMEIAPADLEAGLAAGGSGPELAAIQAPRVDARMAECILALYRSAIDVGAEWQPAVDAMAHRPAMVFHGADDAFVPVEIAARLATRLGAELIVYPDTGHWWAWERADQTAAALTRLWS